MDPLASLSVLLAEDNPVNQRIAMALLTTIGHQVTSCNNGQEAVDAVKDGRFDLVLMDIQMPVMDGLAATQAIRALGDKAKAAIPIIAISANVRDSDLDYYHACGINHVLTKPLRPEKLKALLAFSPPPPEAVQEKIETLLNEAHIADLRAMLKPEKIAELFALAHQSVIEGAASLRDGWAQNDIQQIRRAAHKLAGVAGNFGLQALGQCAAEIEDAARAGGDGGALKAQFEWVLSASMAALSNG